ncbi:MAG: sensor histidine kinase, partial [Geminicoccaceae bacterium]
ARRLAETGLQVLLVDASGNVLYRSSGWPESAIADNGEQSSPGPVVTVPATNGDGAVALLRSSHQPRPEPPWFRNEFWRIPIAQMIALLAIAFAIALFVHYAFLRPLSRMVKAMRQIGTGNLDVRLPRSRVSEVDEAAMALDGMADALRSSLERQEALEQERRMTISAVVHDLRTPLFSLRGYLEGLATGLADTPEKAARYIQVCREKADALERLVADLFAYTRTEYLEEVPRPERLDLAELLRRTVEGLQPQAEAKGVRLWLEAAEETPIVAGDPTLLMRAVENVLDNAIRHTPTGGEVRVSWLDVGKHIAFSVTDSGPGIPAADLPHLFTPLFRGEESRNRRTGGAGLGLTIARRLLRAHGGDLVAANARGGGAVFTGTLPARRQATAADATGVTTASCPPRQRPDIPGTPTHEPSGKA